MDPSRIINTPYTVAFVSITSHDELYAKTVSRRVARGLRAVEFEVAEVVRFPVPLSCPRLESFEAEVERLSPTAKLAAILQFKASIYRKAHR